MSRLSHVRLSVSMKSHVSKTLIARATKSVITASGI